MEKPRTFMLDKIGAIGAMIAAAAAPCCFPLLAVIGSVLGFGVLRSYAGYLTYLMQGLVALALVGNILAYRCHRMDGPLILGVTSPALIFFAYSVWFSTALIYAGLAGLAATAVWNFIANQRHPCCCPVTSHKVEVQSTLTCPRCGFQKEGTMPTDSCVFFYECPNCKTRLKPKQSDCCVFCSYGTVKCPPKQHENNPLHHEKN